MMDGNCHHLTSFRPMIPAVKAGGSGRTTRATEEVMRPISFRQNLPLRTGYHSYHGERSLFGEYEQVMTHTTMAFGER